MSAPQPFRFTNNTSQDPDTNIGWSYLSSPNAADPFSPTQGSFVPVLPGLGSFETALPGLDGSNEGNTSLTRPNVGAEQSMVIGLGDAANGTAAQETSPPGPSPNTSLSQYPAQPNAVQNGIHVFDTEAAGLPPRPPSHHSSEDMDISEDDESDNVSPAARIIVHTQTKARDIASEQAITKTNSLVPVTPAASTHTNGTNLHEASPQVSNAIVTEHNGTAPTTEHASAYTNTVTDHRHAAKEVIRFTHKDGISYEQITPDFHVTELEILRNLYKDLGLPHSTTSTNPLPRPVPTSLPPNVGVLSTNLGLSTGGVAVPETSPITMSSIEKTQANVGGNVLPPSSTSLKKAPTKLPSKPSSGLKEPSSGQGQTATMNRQEYIAKLMAAKTKTVIPPNKATSASTPHNDPPTTKPVDKLTGAKVSAPEATHVPAATKPAETAQEKKAKLARLRALALESVARNKLEKERLAAQERARIREAPPPPDQDSPRWIANEAHSVGSGPAFMKTLGSNANGAGSSRPTTPSSAQHSAGLPRPMSSSEAQPSFGQPSLLTPPLPMVISQPSAEASSRPTSSSLPKRPLSPDDRNHAINQMKRPFGQPHFQPASERLIIEASDDEDEHNAGPATDQDGTANGGVTLSAYESQILEAKKRLELLEKRKKTKTSSGPARSSPAPPEVQKPAEPATPAVEPTTQDDVVMGESQEASIAAEHISAANAEQGDDEEYEPEEWTNVAAPTEVMAVLGEEDEADEEHEASKVSSFTPYESPLRFFRDFTSSI